MGENLLVVFATLSLVLGANTLILSWGFASFQKETLQTKTRILGEHLREQLARAINLGLPLDALEGVNESCREIIEDDKDIGYAMLVDTQSRILYHNDPLLAGRFLRDPASVKASAATDYVVQTRTEDDVRYYDVSIPIFDTDHKLLGSVRLGLKYNSVSAHIYPLLIKSFFVALFTFILASALVSFLVSRKIVNPIVELSGTASQIAEGDLSRRLDISSRDEVGQLADSFNRMAESLREREERIQDGYRDLETANESLQYSYAQLEEAAAELELKGSHLNEKVAELSFLHDATDRLRLSIELDDILSSVVRDTTVGLGYERVLLALVDDSSKTLTERLAIGFDGKDRPPFSEPLDGSSVFAAAVSERGVQYVAQASLDSRVPKHVEESLNLKEFAVIPMVGKDRCVGALIADNRRTSMPIRKDKLDIMNTFASTAAMAVENAYLYRQLVDNLDTVERANRELRMLDRTKTNFLSLASHELRTPLVSVMGYLNLMLAGDLGEISAEQREMLEIAIKGASRLRDIIEDLLMVAKIEGGRMPLKLRWISASDVVGSSIDEIKTFMGGREVAIKTEGLELLPKFEADFSRVQQCFINVIGNAVKYTPDGGRITVSGRKVKVDREKGKIKPVPFDNSILSSDTYLEFVVEDTGIGINKEDLEKIFDKFFEAGDVDMHSTGKSKFLGGGTGLGLSIVKGIVEAHHGRIWAESDCSDAERCPGSRFVMLVPMKQPVSKAEAPLPVMEKEAFARTEASVPNMPKVAAQKPRVLLIEDDEDTIVFTRLILDKKFSVSVAKDGFEGLKKAFSEKPVAILLDVWMHGIDGLEVCRILKENKRTSDIPVAMFTAAAQQHERERGMSAGADDYITKPFTPAELNQRIEKLISSAARVS
ncbi:MAG: response regulator [Nitrospirae bacterium]|nr:response regulator [Nitrospirota bacterium]